MTCRGYLAILALLPAFACGGQGENETPFDPEAPDLRCNGLVELCDRPLDQVVFLRTHNSHAAESLGYPRGSSNHFLAVPQQLADGVRSLNFDLYHEFGETKLCHGFCFLAEQPALEAFSEVASFLDANPAEVILIDLQNETTVEHTVAVMQQSGLAAYAHTQVPGAPWPTLRDLIRADQRLVFFSNGEPGAPSWYHETDDFIYGNGWGYQTPAELDCQIGAAIPHGLLMITHNLTDPVAMPEHADLVNYHPFLRDRFEACMAGWGRAPNAISIDWYSVGDGLDYVRELNSAP